MESKKQQLLKVSNPQTVKNKAKKYFNDSNVKVNVSNEKNKKYSVVNPKNNKIVNFGDIRYTDYTKHHDAKRRQSYLTRAKNIKGNWKNDKYSPNNLSINLLW